VSDMAERHLTVNVAAPTVVLAVNRLKNTFMGISRSYLVCPTSHLPDLHVIFKLVISSAELPASAKCAVVVGFAYTRLITCCCSIQVIPAAPCLARLA
jgi:hypothetical protein